MTKYPRKWLQMMFPEKAIEVQSGSDMVSFSKGQQIGLSLEDQLRLISRFLASDYEISKRSLLFLIDAIIFSADQKTLTLIREDLSDIISIIRNRKTESVENRVRLFDDFDYVLASIYEQKVDLLAFHIKKIKDIFHFKIISDISYQKRSDKLTIYQTKMNATAFTTLRTIPSVKFSETSSTFRFLLSSQTVLSISVDSVKRGVRDPMESGDLPTLVL